MCVGGDTSGNTESEIGLAQDPRGEYRYGGGYSAQTQSAPSTGTYFSNADEQTQSRVKQLTSTINKGSGSVTLGGETVSRLQQYESDSGNQRYVVTTASGKREVSADTYRALQGSFNNLETAKKEAESARSELESLQKAEADRVQRETAAKAEREKQERAKAAAATKAAPVSRPTPKPKVVDSSARLPTNLKPGYVERGPQPQTGAVGLYDQERGRMNVAPKSTGVIQATGTDEPNYPSKPELRDHAIRSIESRIDNRDNPPLALPGAGIITGLNVVGNLFAERMIRDLRDGADPVYGAGGDVIGTQDSSTGELVTGRDELRGFDTVYEAQQDSRRNEDEDDNAPPIARPDRPPSATNPVEVDGNRRTMLAIEQARSPSRSRGPGRRSLFGTA
jgi:hypothetical protein